MVAHNTFIYTNKGLTCMYVLKSNVHSILLLPFVARCVETIYVCIWRMFVFITVVVNV